MVASNYGFYAGYNPQAYAAYQQFLQQNQQQGQETSGSLLANNNAYSLLHTDMGYTQSQQGVSQGYTMQGNQAYPYTQLNNFNNTFTSQYNNDIFASQILAQRPWEKIVPQQTGQQISYTG